MSKSTIHRNSSSLHIGRLHQKQLIREAEEEDKQASSMHISRMLSKEIEKKLEVSQCIRDVMLKSCKKIKDDYNMSRFNSTHHPKESKMGQGRFGKQPEGLKKIQNKIIKIKERMNRILPSEYGLSKV
jgi:chromosome condensin MukBEF ATPase and DNA-binding subunit MukB